MAISPTTGSTATLGGSASTLAFSANTLTNGQYVVVAVSILDPTITVMGIADTGSDVYTLLAATSAGGIRS